MHHNPMKTIAFEHKKINTLHVQGALVESKTYAPQKDPEKHE